MQVWYHGYITQVKDYKKCGQLNILNMAQSNDERDSFFDLLRKAIGSPVQPTFGTTEPEKNADFSDTQTRSHKTASANEKPSDKSTE